MVKILSFQVPVAVTLAAGGGGVGSGGAATPGTQPVTFSVEAQAPMVEPELTEVGELHSLTDWQVSEASEEAELDEFCSGRGGDHTRGPTKSRPHATKK